MENLDLFESLYRRYFPKIYKAAYLVAQDENIAQDSVQEAFWAVGFQIAVPEYLPKGYDFYGAKIPDGGKDSVILIYKKGTEEELRIEEFSTVRESAFSHNFRINDAEIKDLSIKGSEATLIHFNKSGLRQLLYEKGSIYFIITGRLSEEDIIRVAESMKSL
ncbi:DUF4367 domain-containing protein [Thermovorax subterraneus]|nr:DUF4367 domain-containing protein [Thermovorax subterraneus]